MQRPIGTFSSLVHSLLPTSDTVAVTVASVGPYPFNNLTPLCALLDHAASCAPRPRSLPIIISRKLDGISSLRLANSSTTSCQYHVTRFTTLMSCSLTNVQNSAAVRSCLARITTRAPLAHVGNNSSSAT